MAIIDSLLEKGILVSPEVLEDSQLLKKLEALDPVSLEGVDMIDRDFLESKKEEQPSHYKVLFSYDKKPGKINVSDFVSYFNRRFEDLSGYLRQRVEFQGTMSINRLKSKKDREKVSAIGIVFEKAVSKKNSIIITLEDPTGTINVLVRPDKKELYEQAKDVVLDEVMGVEGTISGNYIFADQIFSPDIPSIKELKKSPEEEYAAFVGDTHFGSKVFLEEEFNDFIEWLNQRRGNDEQKAIASKVKYLIFVGDLVEGVGVFPNQEQDLKVVDIRDQYEMFVEYLKRVPEHITMFICPGNHDVGRLSEPQMALSELKYTECLKQLKNAVFLSNPSVFTIGIKKNFPGFDVLLYHGYSLIYYCANVESVRLKGGQKRPDLVMKLLLQKRHLAPSHKSNLYIPDTTADPMIIRHIPDFFVTGHIHRVSVGQYRNISLINASCWNSISESQEKRGLEPQPGKLPIVNLKTREVKIINFMKEKVMKVVPAEDDPVASPSRTQASADAK